MHANSSPITSSQSTIHEQLQKVVAKHAACQFLKPITSYNRDAFDAGIAAWHAAGSKPLILDSGCGVGLSSRHLAARYPDHFVIGVDQSADRLARNTVWAGSDPLPSNYMLVRADLVDFWRLMQDANISPERHYVLYPNPWPKVGHLGRRWHGHPVFPVIVALGGRLEIRSNWSVYVEEWAAALRQLTRCAAEDIAVEQYFTATPITPFERKYLASGHALWRCQTQISALRVEQSHNSATNPQCT